ncbi:MAG: tetratricopeptide repeat protein [Phaeovulum sp.]|uniref:tetratricopeptide repeat protein n=1 Tax=Phaeovulum sp. TaxID=2934796 RepID=UPI00272FFDBD|nr:tetratricopeptide repeat protein [Phaeovulum sp.]MDP2062312.1 tetratricopeptide repeat protein [Phaeovulum sp.]MDP3860207.1 tetratricopeptide repeat protein [Phaeovulum sp.]
MAKLKHIVAAGLAVLALALPLAAQDPAAQLSGGRAAQLDALFAELTDPENRTWRRSEADIRRLWSQSGSAAMDLLYKRGEAALDADDPALAVEHLTALTDHAPDFAEGWHLRAVAYYKTGEIGPALADLARALALEPRHWTALSGLGTILENVGMNESALAAFRASLALHPHQDDVKDEIARLTREVTGVSL